MPGVLAISGPTWQNAQQGESSANELCNAIGQQISVDDFPLLILCDDAEFTANSLNNFLWVTFTRSNPSHDIFGIDSFFAYKHWGCNGPLLIDARIKTHHAPILEVDAAVEKSAAEKLHRAAKANKIG